MNLTTGWLPITLQVLVGLVLVAAIGWRTRRWRLVWLPIASVTGVALAALVHWYIGYQGWSQDPAPAIMWVWIALTGLAAVVAVAGWRGIDWWQRVVSILAVPLALFCAALALNIWVGYFPTVQSAWERVTDTTPARWVDQSTAADMHSRGVRPAQGVVVKITTPSQASGFAHRQEFVYLPPAWFATNPPPRLPAVMMFGGQFGQPDDWLRSADALETLDAFTAKHRGNAPVVVFPDIAGQFSNDTECVNGPRGNAADHLTKDFLPFVISNFGVSPDAANWGLAGWSSGGTCALMLAVMHPELFSAFVDIDGQPGPNAGTHEQTITRLFGGDAEAWASFDPQSVIAKHGRYSEMAALFAVASPTPAEYYAAGDPAVPNAPAPPHLDGNSEDHADVAKTLCSLVSSHGIECAVISTNASHDFAGAGKAFAAALPWLAGRIGTPGVHPIPLPGAPAN